MENCKVHLGRTFDVRTMANFKAWRFYFVTSLIIFFHFRLNFICVGARVKCHKKHCRVNHTMNYDTIFSLVVGQSFMCDHFPINLCAGNQTACVFIQHHFTTWRLARKCVRFVTLKSIVVKFFTILNRVQTANAARIPLPSTKLMYTHTYDITLTIQA